MSEKCESPCQQPGPHVSRKISKAKGFSGKFCFKLCQVSSSYYKRMNNHLEALANIILSKGSTLQTTGIRKKSSNIIITNNQSNKPKPV